MILSSGLSQNFPKDKKNKWEIMSSYDNTVKSLNAFNKKD